MNQISPDESIGKTVAKVHNNGDGLVVVFTDGTYIYASAVSSNGDYYFSTSHSFTEDAKPQDLLAIGLISQSQYNDLKRVEKDRDEERELRLYEKLRSKFEKP